MGLRAVFGRARHSVRAVCERQAAGKGLPALPSWLRVRGCYGVFLFFYPLEDDLDLNEEGEEERR
jgi:hypothetical protein